MYLQVMMMNMMIRYLYIDLFRNVDFYIFSSNIQQPKQ